MIEINTVKVDCAKSNNPIERASITRVEINTL
jgi:hypothetical protein